MLSQEPTSSVHALLCLRQCSTAAMGRTARSPTGARRPSVRGGKTMASWMSGARSVRFMIWLMLARETCARRARSA
ncbi:MAG: hypothetical protein AMS14_11680 [Planctomycetes bacterium DG_20]|nr:MAG: hypothetical protein AMS14_11680 [Planctomycetes bacterium DG_20]